MEIGGRREHIDDRRRPMYYAILFKEVEGHKAPKRMGKKMATGYPIFAFDSVNFRYKSKKIAQNMGFELWDVYKGDLQNKQVKSAMRLYGEDDFIECIKSEPVLTAVEEMING